MADEFTVGYREGYKEGYQHGLEDGRQQGFSDATHRVWNVVDQQGDPDLERAVTAAVGPRDFS
jgi:flagellar biosynthesis/type III secretory pathway protein FliH